MLIVTGPVPGSEVTAVVSLAGVEGEDVTALASVNGPVVGVEPVAEGLGGATNRVGVSGATPGSAYTCPGVTCVHPQRRINPAAVTAVTGWRLTQVPPDVAGAAPGTPQ